MFRIAFASLFGLLLAGMAVSSPEVPPRDEPSYCATCVGADPCKACKNCKYCKRCHKDGKTCGVCRKK